ncbi:DNA (cytosine-5)-methyltransferase 1 [Anoxybacillus mongoliensis]|uniref:Cytosine-specific methyltransferase n=1 Tax=Anoxybacillus mongoliensis TaxID=452565 RepID=A0A7W8JEJ5_9BACL|nr:DNA cytosine methyltransferase [Anoxybacillus mongoliensis]MBB5355240.1 DNA (cytosine-5)-methyltransferase 1 [Anoxybacillus mongoliensis]
MGNYKFIDLFAGIGGFRIAFESLSAHNMECVFSSEIDKFAREVYKHNFGDIPAGDITKIKASEIPDFDILAAGFPCQPFSYAGRLEGFEDKVRGTLFFDIVRILKEKRPKMFILENVKGLKSHKKGETLKIIEDTLKQLDYTIYWEILDSYDFGVPQYRQRWFCVGFDKEIYFEFPKGNQRGKVLRDIVDINNNDESLKLSQFEIDRINFHFSSNEVRVKHDNSKYAPNTKKGKYGIYSYLKPDNTLRFHIGDKAKTQIQEAYYSSLDSVAPAIIASREPKLWDLKRRLSVEECKRLQGFPEWFEFNVSNVQAKKQLGNAVTVPVVRAIVDKMIYYYEANIPIKEPEQLILELKC